MTRSPTVRSVGAADFKQHCLSLLDDVAATGRTLVVTKHGRPVARIVPIDETEENGLIGSVSLLAERPEDYYSAKDRWDSETP